MKSSRATHSVSSASSRSYITEPTRHRSCSSRHTNATKKPTRKMKFIIAIGIALPIVAAIIGVVAWAVSADSAFHGPMANGLRRADIPYEHHDEDIFQALEDRQDIEFSRHVAPPNQDIGKQDYSRLDSTENHNQFDDSPNKDDPLYIVHFVPSPKPKVESSTSGPNIVSSVSPDVLQKILSASKGAKPGTPQFVVFAPVPDEDDPKTEAGSLDIGTQGLNLFSNPKKTNPQIDYDYEEELRKYQELLDSTGNPPQKETSRVGKSKDNTETQTEIQKLASKLLVQNITAGNIYQSQLNQLSPQVSSNLLQANYNQKQLLDQYQALVTKQNNQQNQGYSQGYQSGISQGYAQQPIQQTQKYEQYQQYPQQQSYTNQQVYPQPQATDRSGQYEPVGIKLNFGGGRGLLGGNYSPLGIIGSIVRSLIPRPQVNLNGKVMFGVVLEKGLKFGENRNQNNYG